MTFTMFGWPWKSTSHAGIDECILIIFVLYVFKIEDSIFDIPILVKLSDDLENPG